MKYCIKLWMKWYFSDFTLNLPPGKFYPSWVEIVESIIPTRIRQTIRLMDHQWWWTVDRTQPKLTLLKLGAYLLIPLILCCLYMLLDRCIRFLIFNYHMFTRKNDIPFTCSAPSIENVLPSGFCDWRNC